MKGDVCQPWQDARLTRPLARSPSGNARGFAMYLLLPLLHGCLLFSLHLPCPLGKRYSISELTFGIAEVFASEWWVRSKPFLLCCLLVYFLQEPGYPPWMEKLVRLAQ